ncbi:MAG: MarR family transcriptional regulator [Clostridia bacterium]|nr:MarR family transcriptional regulator [Clostridia bacterium]
MRDKLISLIDKFFLESYKSFFETLNTFTGPDENVSYREFSICDLIERHPGCNMSFIAARLEVTNSAVTQQVNSLLKKGYVDKTHFESDKRNKGLAITEKYKELVDKANHLIFGKFCDELTDDEKQSLYTILSRSSTMSDNK